MADRDELIGELIELVDRESMAYRLLEVCEGYGVSQEFALDVIDGGIDLGGGRRIAIIEEVTLMEPMVANAGAKIVLIVTPDPEES